ncbi:CerR family C-terminal domain-containing protein [Paracoccus aminovorans]|uniref:CerR family C-terminal domain-containing protein n=1 Tax=Paracoccus aminovorans TaxID=34004 RepID=UPI0007803CAF|nr:CerR family C-terminal domain-containing protein [Paracoccus aminovorans]MDQ7777186.1 CerR family C-terminal domain-containing protein [Paracoccus aminovorans]
MIEIPDKPPEGAQKALIEAGLLLFGQKGFDATSTRELAAKAGVNLALIAYHFGGKDGLRRAVVGEVARRLMAVAGAPRSSAGLTPAAALRRLQTILRGVAAFIGSAPEAGPMVNFALTELSRGGAATELIHDCFIGPKHAELSELWAIASGADPDSEAVKLSVFAMIGQVLYFRLGREIVMRRMGWPTIGPSEAGRIGDVIAENLRLLTQGEPR